MCTFLTSLTLSSCDTFLQMPMDGKRATKQMAHIIGTSLSGGKDACHTITEFTRKAIKQVASIVLISR